MSSSPKYHISTNVGNPNALKLIIAAKLAQKNVSIQLKDPSGESINLFLLSLISKINS